MAKAKRKSKRGPAATSVSLQKSLAELHQESEELKRQIASRKTSIKQRLKTHALFNHINEAIIQGKSLRTIAVLMIKAVQKAGVVQRVGVFLHDRTGHIRGIMGVDPQCRLEDISGTVYQLSRKDTPPTSLALQSKDGTFFTKNIWRDRRIKASMDGIDPRVKSHAAFILRLYGRVVGLLAVDDLGLGRAITAKDVETLKIIADQLAVVLENALLIEEARKKIETLLQLTDFSSHLISIQREGILRHEIVKMTRRIFFAQVSAMLLVSEDGKQIRCAEISGVKKISHFVASAGKPITAKSIQNSSKLFLHQLSEKSGIEIYTHICVPLVLRSKIRGALLVLNRRKRDNFTSSDFELMTALANQAIVALENARIYEDTRGLYLDVVQAMVKAIEAKDPYTYGHSARVTKYSLAIGNTLSLAAEELEELRLAALLHDIGKIGVNDKLLSKTGKLNHQEWRSMKNHPQLGKDILQGIGLMERILPGISHHHEHFAGTGYPDRLRGKKIPLFGRIIAVADAYDAMTSDRAYRKKLNKKEAQRELLLYSGKQFDGQIVQAFISALATVKTH